jgi:hypothetical protein
MLKAERNAPSLKVSNTIDTSSEFALQEKYKHSIPAESFFELG